MTKGDKEVPELVRAAEALEAELVTLENSSRSVRKIRLDSEKNIARALKELNEALALPNRLAAGLRSFGAAMESMQARQQAALEPLASRAAEIQQRMQKHVEHMEAFAALGKAAAEASMLTKSENGGREAAMATARTELKKIDDGARALVEAARADDFPEIAREADALRQRTSALRKRLDEA